MSDFTNCHLCGCVVWDSELHITWHMQVEADWDNEDDSKERVTDVIKPSQEPLDLSAELHKVHIATQQDVLGCPHCDAQAT